MPSEAAYLLGVGVACFAALVALSITAMLHRRIGDIESAGRDAKPSPNQGVGQEPTDVV